MNKVAKRHYKKSSPKKPLEKNRVKLHIQQTMVNQELRSLQEEIVNLLLLNNLPQATPF